MSIFCLRLSREAIAHQGKEEQLWPNMCYHESLPTGELLHAVRKTYLENMRRAERRHELHEVQVGYALVSIPHFRVSRGRVHHVHHLFLAQVLPQKVQRPLEIIGRDVTLNRIENARKQSQCILPCQREEKRAEHWAHRIESNRSHARDITERKQMFTPLYCMLTRARVSRVAASGTMRNDISSPSLANPHSVSVFRQSSGKKDTLFRCLVHRKHP